MQSPFMHKQLNKYLTTLLWKSVSFSVSILEYLQPFGAVSNSSSATNTFMYTEY
jgi:hypothetical protein